MGSITEDYIQTGQEVDAQRLRDLKAECLAVMKQGLADEQVTELIAEDAFLPSFKLQLLHSTCQREKGNRKELENQLEEAKRSQQE